MCSKAVWLFSDVADLSQFAISSDRILCSFDTNNSFCVSRDLHALMIRASVIFIPSHLHLNNSDCTCTCKLNLKFLQEDMTE